MQQKSEGKFPRFFGAMMARPIRAPAAAQRRFFPAEGRFFCLMVARWDATFCSFRGIGRGGTAVPLGGFAGTGAPAWPDMRGALPLCIPHEGALRPSTPGDFRFTTKVTKGVPGALPLDPVGGPTEKCSTFQSHPPSDALRRSPQKREGATKGRGICHFEVVRAIGISFS